MIWGTLRLGDLVKRLPPPSPLVMDKVPPLRGKGFTTKYLTCTKIESIVQNGYFIPPQGPIKSFQLRFSYVWSIFYYRYSIGI